MSGFDHFNLISPIYDLVFGRHVDHTMVAKADLQPDQKLLDVGGGTGRVTALFAEVSSDLLIADSAISMLRRAQEKSLRTVNTHSEKLPFAAQTFDRIIMVDALHHVADQQETLNEMWRVLAVGGKMVVEEPNKKNFIVKLIALGEKILMMRSHFLLPEEIVRMCQFDPSAEIETHFERGNAWIIIAKGNSSEG